MLVTAVKGLSVGLCMCISWKMKVVVFILRINTYSVFLKVCAQEDKKPEVKTWRSHPLGTLPLRTLLYMFQFFSETHTHTHVHSPLRCVKTRMTQNLPSISVVLRAGSAPCPGPAVHPVALVFSEPGTLSPLNTQPPRPSPALAPIFQLLSQ